MNVNEPIVVDWDAVAIERPQPGVERQTVHGERQTLVRYRYAPGAVFPVHAHPEEQMTIVLHGVIAFTIGDQKRRLGPGDIAIIPAWLAHGAQVIGTDEVETLNALSPRRDADPLASAAR